MEGAQRLAAGHRRADSVDWGCCDRADVLYSLRPRGQRQVCLCCTRVHEEDSLIIESLVVGPIQTNCHIVGDEATREAVVIDPGGDADLILEAVRRLDLKVKLVVNTHGHFDHLMANREVMEATGAPLAIHPADAKMLTNPLRSFAFLLGKLRPSPPATVWLEEGATVEVVR